MKKNCEHIREAATDARYSYKLIYYDMPAAESLEGRMGRGVSRLSSGYP